MFRYIRRYRDSSVASEGAKKCAPETARLYFIKWSYFPLPVLPIMRASTEPANDFETPRFWN